ncbi:bacterioferritin [Corallococcus interemptor]|uniref:ferritin-like domain-containing protein n=1 Tax=Corallococcus interemptor TaxID=2316720 RepID=UPI0035D50611
MADMQPQPSDTELGDLGVRITLLNAALATKVVCVRRYTRHALLAGGACHDAMRAAFGLHARDEQDHALRLAERIQQLGGRPDFNLGGLMSSGDTRDDEGRTLVELLRENLEAERVAIASYRDLIPYFAERDPTTRRLLEELLADEEAHANALHALLKP